jgi:plasmid stability protein
MLVYAVVMGRNIQIRDVPDDVHRELATRAAAAGLSLTVYLREELRRIAARPPVAEMLARAAARHGGARIDEIVAAVRSSRDRG